MTEFESVCRSSKGYAGDLIYHIPLPDGKIRYVRLETTSEADAQVGLVEGCDGCHHRAASNRA